jgi:hypothetical protein
VNDNETDAVGGCRADDSGFILSQILTPLAQFHHADGAVD